MPGDDLLDDSAVLAGIADGYNDASELAGQGRSIVIQRFNLKKAILTWGSLVGTILAGAVYLGYHYSEMCSQIEINTKANNESHKTHHEFKEKVEENTKAIEKHHVVLVRVETTQGLNAKTHERRFDRQERILERIAEQVGATND